MQERPYQTDLERAVQAAWAGGYHNVLMRLDTGGGKTFILACLIARHLGFSCVIAHRQELVGQLSNALAAQGVRHNIIAAKETVRAIIAEHLALYGRSYYDPSARCAVASVDTLIRAKGLAAWAAQVTFWVVDEGHHLVLDNKWHKAIVLFTHLDCRGLLCTATPSRADGQGLGRGQDGLADVMVQGPPMRWLIEQGYLTDYEVVCPESDMVLLEESIGASGDYSTATLRAAARASHIVGDTVQSYLTHRLPGPAVTFTPDTDTAADVCAAYNAAGVRARLLTGTTDGGLRRKMLKELAAHSVDQLVVVDIVSEGFDLPAIVTGSMIRKTNSLALYMQQLGRLLRPIYAPGFDLDTQAGRLAAIAAGPKPTARLIDHVGNFLRHGPPDRPRPWTLNRRDKRAKQVNDGIPMRVCAGDIPRVICEKPYERTESVCPYCGTPAPLPVARDSPKAVDGDMSLLDPVTLAALRGAVVAVDESGMDYAQRLAATGLDPAFVARNTRLHEAKQAGQRELRQAMARWGGPRHAAGRDDAQMQREFYLTFGTDVLSAQALPTAAASALAQQIEAALAHL